MTGWGISTLLMNPVIHHRANTHSKISMSGRLSRSLSMRPVTHSMREIASRAMGTQARLTLLKC